MKLSSVSSVEAEDSTSAAPTGSDRPPAPVDELFCIPSGASPLIRHHFFVTLKAMTNIFVCLNDQTIILVLLVGESVRTHFKVVISAATESDNKFFIVKLGFSDASGRRAMALSSANIVLRTLF